MLYKQNKGKKYWLLLGFLMLLLCIAAVAYVGKQAIYFKGEYEQKIEEYATIEAENKHILYAPNKDIRAGEILKKEDILLGEHLTSLNVEQFITGVDGKSAALVDIPKGMPITKNLLSEERLDFGVREEEFNVFHLSANLKLEDVVDVRILFPNGENYIVLAKKRLKQLNQETAECYLWLDEQETLLISSAIVDAYLTPGCLLYTTRYIESNIQDASHITYVPSEQVAELIKTSPNIVEKAKMKLNAQVRKALEERLVPYKARPEEKGEVENIDQSLETFLYKDGGDGKVNNEYQKADDISSADRVTNGMNQTEEEGEILYVD